ncbi:hypothetical protein [Oligosphaera ethanolica]|uniref:Uncharacterized protein n=1 Tax=Oligosphaera ethanolica TaxID=760260 RepID=A0AAE4AQ09_9BACT|nr:hypothetical protein [Oligosphaera ethanolica]MDQ0290578.1 hypothetical protein [Oligosphaera ethanolica]
MMTVTRSLVESFPIVCRAHYVQMLSSAFAKTAMLLKGKSESYQQPWRKTADRLRETDNAAFSEYRDTFYKFLFASTTAALLAHEASASDSSIAQSFLAEYREVREFHAWLDSSASETGLSGKLKDEATELYAAWQKLETHQ